MRDTGARSRIDEIDKQLGKLGAKLGWYRGIIGNWGEWEQGETREEAQRRQQNDIMKQQLASTKEQLDYAQTDLYQGLTQLREDFATLVEFLGLERSRAAWQHKEKP